MPGPPRFFQSNAERQRAYRRRKRQELAAEQEAVTAELDDARCASIYATLLTAAVQAANAAGHPLAVQVHRPEPFDTLRALIDYFHDGAETPPAARPWRDR